MKEVWRCSYTTLSNKETFVQWLETPEERDAYMAVAPTAGNPVAVRYALAADRPEQAPQADELAELRRFVDHARAVVNAAIEMYPHARSSKLNDALDAMNTEALRQATKPQQAPHGALGVAEMAQMLTTARAPDRCTPFEHEVTGLPFSGTSKPDKPGT
jgi:hypothetical protein